MPGIRYLRVPGFLTRMKKMKRAISLTICICTLILAGCGITYPDARIINETTGVKSILQSAMTEEESVSTSQSSEESISEPDKAAPDSESIPENSGSSEDIIKKDVDIDLTVDNANLVYAEVFAMLYSPEEYIGKTVKMKGQFTFYYDEERNQYYYACIIADALACCSQGLEFIPAGECVYPDNFPPALTEIWVTGEFGVFEDDGTTYCALKDAVYYY